MHKATPDVRTKPQLCRDMHQQAMDQGDITKTFLTSARPRNLTAVIARPSMSFAAIMSLFALAVTKFASFRIKLDQAYQYYIPVAHFFTTPFDYLDQRMGLLPDT